MPDAVAVEKTHICNSVLSFSISNVGNVSLKKGSQCEFCGMPHKIRSNNRESWSNVGNQANGRGNFGY